MKQTLYIIFSVAIFISCSSRPEEQKIQTVEPREGLNKNGLEIDAQLLAKLESELSIMCKPFKKQVDKYISGGEDQQYSINTGVFFPFVKEEQAHTIFKKYHDEVLKSGNYLFLTHLDFDDSYNTYYDIVIVKGRDQFDIVDQIGTEAVNYNHDNIEIIKKLKEWDKQVGLTIEVIDGERVHAYINETPLDVELFAKDIYEFCPDVIDQGYESMGEMVQDIRRNKYIWLWWD